MPAQPVPLERMMARSTNGRTLGGRKLEVIDTSEMERVDAPPLPDGLGERGEIEWRKIWWAGKWLWPDQDYHLVEMIARAYDEIAAFRKEIEAIGLTVEGYNGQTTANPLIAEVRKAESMIVKNLSLLGFSPSDRARLKLTELKGEKAARDLLNEASTEAQVIESYVEDEW